MGFIAKWYIEPLAIVVTYSGVFCLEDVEASIRQKHRMSADYPDRMVHTLVDLTEVEQVNFKLLELRDAVSKLMEYFPLQGWIVVVMNSNPSGLRLMLNTVGRYFGVHFRIFDTPKEADLFLSQMAAKIHPNG